MARYIVDYEKYAKLRDARELTDYQVCMKTDIKAATISSWKTGAYAPKIEKLIAIAKLFNVPLEFFVTEVEGKEESK